MGMVGDSIGITRYCVKHESKIFSNLLGSSKSPLGESYRNDNIGEIN